MINITEVDVFNKQILNDDGLKIVRFCAEWSGPCHIMEPIYLEMALTYRTSASFYKIDIDKMPLLKKKFGVTELPTILFLQNRVIIDFIIGLISRKALMEKLEKAIK